MTDYASQYEQLELGQDCNYWELDPVFRREAERIYPATEFAWAESVLADVGNLAGHQIAENAGPIDSEGQELHTYDRHGNRYNHVEYHPLQAENDEAVYERGLTHDAFHAPPGRDEPVGFQHVLLAQSLLAHADGGLVCPVSMTTGAAIVLDRFVEDDHPNADLLQDYFERLTSREFESHIEGAMFLTEKQGGSDVGANEVRAEPTAEDGVYELHGEKWFCSNIDAEGTLALARRPDAPDGIEGLSLFLVPHTRRDGELNDQLYRRLKDKLGTISVPTGEVEFEGAEAFLVGEPESGFRYMAEMMNFERLTQATGSIGGIGRALLESKAHAASREAFGDTIDQYPLMRRDLVDMQTDYEAGMAFGFEATKWYARYMRETGEGEASSGATPGGRGAVPPAAADAERATVLMRLLTPIAKYRLARMAVETTSYACEVKGGNGYVEGFATEQMLRDAQVGPIWEGTSNILALDVLRVLQDHDAHEDLLWLVRQHLDAADHEELAGLRETVEDGVAALQTALAALATEDTDYAQHEAKELADLVFDVVAAAVLLSTAAGRLDAGDARKALLARWFVTTRFDRDEARGIATGESLPDECYEELVTFAPVSDETVAQFLG